MLEIDDRDMDEFKETLKYFEEKFPKESKSMLRKVGNKVRTIVKREARNSVGKKTGNYVRSIKRGKVFVDAGADTVRIYTSSLIAPHGHLIENGHKIVTKSGKEVGYKEGYHVFDKATSEINSNFDRIVESELDKAFNKL